jgi:NAD(P)-dependent dehydrogenase (short-subunit alcohol dehydrogenase family)
MEYNEAMTKRVGIVTGASRGLGLALARDLSHRGWTLIVDGRNADALHEATADVPGVTAIPGDVVDPAHRQALVDAAANHGRLDLLVNNASILGPSPQPRLADYPLDVMALVYHVNTVAPLALAQLGLPLLRAAHGTILNITSDASVEPYEGWGGYGSSKAALDHISRILDAEEPDVTVHAVDPGDMRTQLHQEAFPGEDISDRPRPEESVPGLVALLENPRAGGRYRVSDLLAGSGARP